MAKHRKQKKKTSQNSPLEKPEIDESIRQERILPIIASLKSTNLAERTVTLGALANIIEDPKMRHMLLRERLIHVILSHTLSDSSLELVAEGFGVLRNLVLAEGRDTALFLVREHIRLPLNAVSAKSKLTLAEIDTLDKQGLEMLNQMIENIFGLVTAIVITLGELIDVSDVVMLALDLVVTRSQKILKQTYDSAFEVLYYLSEDNDDLLEQLFMPDSIQSLRTVSSELNTWQSRIYELGIECNYSILSNDMSPGDVTKLVEQLIVYLTQVPTTELNSLQVCLELLALVAQTNDAQILHELLSTAVPRVLDLLADKQYALRAVSFLNNVGWALNGLKEDWASQAEIVFDRAVSACFGAENDGELITSTLGLLSATIVQNEGLIRNESLIHAFPNLFERVDALFRQGDEEWVALACALVNVLGSTAAHIALVSQTSDLIFSLLEHAESIQSQIDALNALFDLFGDNEAPFEQTEYKDKHLNAKLEQLHPRIKRILKSAGKGPSALKDQADDALHNLDNFIVYKRG